MRCTGKIAFSISAAIIGMCLVYTFFASPRSVELTRVWSSLVSAPCPLPGTGALARRVLPVTAMVSFPGAGTRWTRYLLTSASGILGGGTGSNSRTIPITEWHAHRVIGIKSHETVKTTRKIFPAPLERGVVIVRSPYEIILANFNRLGDVREGNGQKPYSSRARFEREWSQYVSESMKDWPELYLDWAQSDVPVHVLVYSRMKSDLRRELESVFRFLNIPANIDCAMQSPEGFAHRQKQSWQDEVAVFSEEQVLFLNKAIDEVQAAFQRKTGVKFDYFQAWKR